MARRIAIESFLVLLVGIILGLFGPFGTYEIGAAARLAYWIVFTLAGYAIFRPMLVVGGWLAEALKLPNFVGIALALVVAAVPMTFLVALLLSGFDIGSITRWEGLGLLYFQVWLIGFLINGLMMMLFRKDASEVEAVTAMTPTPPAPQAPAFAERLPLGFGAIHALKGEDHYVRVFGETRQELILLRLRDAMTEMAGSDGLQVHRSWWVARQGVARIRRDGREAIISLPDGSEVPVSRDAMPRLREAGWL